MNSHVQNFFKEFMDLILLPKLRRRSLGFLMILAGLQSFSLHGGDEKISGSSTAPSSGSGPAYSLPELLRRAETNALLKKEIDAIQRTAALKIQEVERARWLSTFEAKAFGGVVPDVALSNPADVNSYQSYDFENDFSFNHLGGFINTQIEMIQPLYTFGKITSYQEAAKRAPILANWEAKKKLSELKYMVKRAYYTRLLSSESIVILNEVHRKLKEAADKVEELLIKESDNVTETDRLKIKVFQADVQNRLLDAERGNKLSFSALSELCDLNGNWGVSEEHLEAEQMDQIQKEDVISASLRARPDIQQLQALVEIKQNEYNATRAQLFPTIFAAGQVEFAYAPGREDIKNPFLVDQFNKFNLGVVLGMKQDLGFFRTFNKMDQFQAELDRLKAQKEQLAVKVRLDAEKAYEEAVAAYQAIQVNEDGFRAARSWLTSAGLSFNLGTADTKDILESFAAYFKARADLLRSIYNVNIALSDLSSTAGIEVVDRLK